MSDVGDENPEFVKLVLPLALYERLLALAIERGTSIAEMLDDDYSPPTITVVRRIDPGEGR